MTTKTSAIEKGVDIDGDGIVKPKTVDTIASKEPTHKPRISVLSGIDMQAFGSPIITSTSPEPMTKPGMISPIDLGRTALDTNTSPTSGVDSQNASPATWTVPVIEIKDYFHEAAAYKLRKSMAKLAASGVLPQPSDTVNVTTTQPISTVVNPPPLPTVLPTVVDDGDDDEDDEMFQDALGEFGGIVVSDKDIGDIDVLESKVGELEPVLDDDRDTVGDDDGDDDGSEGGDVVVSISKDLHASSIHTAEPVDDPLSLPLFVANAGATEVKGVWFDGVGPGLSQEYLGRGVYTTSLKSDPHHFDPGNATDPLSAVLETSPDEFSGDSTGMACGRLTLRFLLRKVDVDVRIFGGRDWDGTVNQPVGGVHALFSEGVGNARAVPAAGRRVEETIEVSLKGLGVSLKSYSHKGVGSGSTTVPHRAWSLDSVVVLAIQDIEVTDKIRSSPLNLILG